MPHSQITAVQSSQTNEIMRKHNLAITGEGEHYLIFAHGFGCDQSVWHRVAPAYEANFRVVLFDYVGCGRSDLREYKQQHYNNLQAYADDLLKICDALGIKSAYFVGHSVSGAIGMLASIARPGLFAKLITIGPSPCYLNEPPHYYGGFNQSDIDSMLDMMDRNYFEWADYLAPLVVGDATRPEVADELKLSFLRTDPIICRTFAEVTFQCDIRNILPLVPVAVVIMYCSEDIIVPLEVIDYLHTKLPHSTTKKLDAAGHYPQLMSPHAVIQALNEELKIVS